VNLCLESSTTVFACRDGLIEAKVADEIVAPSIEQGICYGMNRVSSSTSKLLPRPIRICDLYAALLAAYRVDPNLCERQVLNLLDELRAEGLIGTLEEI
jgi:Coenzyme PQQ synthesis protein D (PqqD)